MHVLLPNGLCTANMPALLRHLGYSDWSDSSRLSLGSTYRDKISTCRTAFPLCSPGSPRKHGLLRRRRCKDVVAKLESPPPPKRLVKAHITRGLRTLVLEKEPDDAEKGVSEASTLSGPRKIEVVGRDIDLEHEMQLMREKQSLSSRRRKKQRESKIKLEDLQSLTVYIADQVSRASEATKEVQIRSEGDAANLAESDEGHFSSDSESVLILGRGQHINGSTHVATNVEKDLASSVRSLDGLLDSNDGRSISPLEGLVPVKEQSTLALSELSGGGRLVADFTTAWDGLAGKLSLSSVPAKQTQQLLIALKLCVSAVRRASKDGRTLLSRSLSIAYTLADLQMDAVVVAAGLLHSVVEAGLVGTRLVDQQLGSEVSRLLHDCMRFKRTVDQMDLLDEESARAARRFCLSYHDIRSIIIGFTAQLYRIRHMQDLPRYHQHMLALEALHVHAPLAQAIAMEEVSQELEDLAFKVILPESYESLDKWFRSQWPDVNVLENCKRKLSVSLEEDVQLKTLIDGFTISGRWKSRFSTMKKLLKDGRKPEGVYDIAGLRVVVNPHRSLTPSEAREKGVEACYRVLEIARSLWREVPGRLKDYIAKPKSNGYESLHVAVYLNTPDFKRSIMELQIRTSVMDYMASGGDASHSFYKGGLTDPEQVQQLKKLMMAAADRAALSLKELAGESMSLSSPAEKDQVFMFFDKNSDGKISMAEFHQVMVELGADQDEAKELMQLVDTNNDGSVSADEFAEFRKQVRFLRGFEGFDKHFSSRLGWTLRDASRSRNLSSDKGISNARPLEDGTAKTPVAEHKSEDGTSKVVSVEGPQIDLNASLRRLSTTPHMDVYNSTTGSDKDGNSKMSPGENKSVNGSAKSTVVEQKSRNGSKKTLATEREINGSLKAGAVLEFELKLMTSSKSPSTTNSMKSTEQGPAKSKSDAGDLRVGHSFSDFTEILRDDSSFDALSNWNEEEAMRLERIENSSKSSTSFSDVNLHSLRPSKLAGLLRPTTPSSRKETTTGMAETASEDAQETKLLDLQEGLRNIRRLIRARKFVAASSVAEQLYKQYPDNTDVLVEYAYVKRQLGDLVGAGALYSHAVKAFKRQDNLGYEYIRALQSWGSVEAQAFNTARARVLFMDSINAARREERRSPGTVDGAAVYGLHAWAKMEERLGNWSKAIELLDKAAEIQPGNAVVHQSRALLEAKVHNWGAARHHFRLAVKAAPNDVKCWQAWAVFEANQNNLERMRQLFQRALEVDPKSVYSLQAWAYQEALIDTPDSKEKARSLYQRCTETEPDNLFSWQAWAVMEQNSGNYHKARELFEKCLSVDPFCIASLQAFAKMERSCGHLEAAQNLLRRALRLQPENAAVLMEAAFLEEELGNASLAEKLFKLAGMADKQRNRVRHRMFLSRNATRPKRSLPKYRAKHKIFRQGKLEEGAVKKQKRQEQQSGSQQMISALGA